MKFIVSQLWLPVFYIFLCEAAISQQPGDITAPTKQIEFGVMRFDGNDFRLTRAMTYFETQELEYLVEVPVTTTDSKGKVVTTTTTETRVRTVTVPKYRSEEAAISEQAVSFSSVAGKKVQDIAQVKKFLGKPTRVVITFDQQPLEEYYTSVLQKNLVVVHLDMGQTATEGGELPPAPVVDPVADDIFGP